MQELFPGDREALELLFPAMERQGWIRRDEPLYAGTSVLPGRKSLHAQNHRLFRGGWRYRNFLLDRKIWSNFPPAEEDYALELSGKTIADLPSSIVRQLEPVDRVHLTGKRLQVLQIIDDEERKRVTAEPTEHLDDKEILWLGIGFQVSYETAQSVRAVLPSSEETSDRMALGLFARAQRLLQEELERSERLVTLANGIEVLREESGFYRYRTFLRSLGNLMLRRVIESDLGTEEDLYVVSDEIGILCSHHIPFQELHLPLNREGFRLWVGKHVRSLRALFSLNTFCDALPPALLIEELTDFLFDPRVAEAFSRYLTESSDIVSGDPALLDRKMPEPEKPPQTFLDTTPPVEPLLEWEKRRWGSSEEGAVFRLSPNARHRPRTVTGTMIGEYIRHYQCKRWLSFNFLHPDERPPRRTRVDTDLETVRTEQGRLHEKRMLTHLRNEGNTLISIEETDRNGSPRPLQERFTETREKLEHLMCCVKTDESIYLSQAVLILPSLFDREASRLYRVDGVGIPDLIRISVSADGPLLEAGDIKDSPVPYYSQKWQVAFYALLLKKALQIWKLRAEVTGSGFLITRPHRGTEAPAVHSFDLSPYMAAFPALFENMENVLLNPPSEADDQLGEHCTTCPFFETCYRQALQEEDILLLPRLTPGILQKMRQLGLKNIEEAGRWFETINR